MSQTTSNRGAPKSSALDVLITASTEPLAELCEQKKKDSTITVSYSALLWPNADQKHLLAKHHLTLYGSFCQCRPTSHLSQDCAT